MRKPWVEGGGGAEGKEREDRESREGKIKWRSWPIRQLIRPEIRKSAFERHLLSSTENTVDVASSKALSASTATPLPPLHNPLWYRDFLRFPILL